MHPHPYQFLYNHNTTQHIREKSAASIELPSLLGTRKLEDLGIASREEKTYLLSMTFPNLDNNVASGSVEQPDTPHSPSLEWLKVS